MMATKEGQTSLRSTLSKDCVENFDLSCDPCLTDNLHLEAIGFCPTCNEFLCQTCYKHHNKFAATKHHKLLDKSSMPKTKVAVKVKDLLTEACTKHPDKLLEYVCNVHEEVGCTACMTVNHATCQDKYYVPDVSDGFINNGEWKNLYIDLDHLLSMATEHKITIDKAEKNNSGYISKCLDQIKSQRKQIDAMLDKLQQNAELKVKSIYQDNKDKITKTSVECQAIITKLQNRITDLNTKERDRKKNQLYVDVKLTNKTTSYIRRQLQDMNRWQIIRYEIGENEKLHELESTLSDMLSLSVQQDEPYTKARYLKEISVKTNEDQKDCSVYGIAVMTGGRVVVTDGNNKAVKLIDVKKNKVISRVTVSATSRGLTAIETNKVAVTLDNSTIVLINVTGVLSIIKVIQVPNTDMYGICSYKDNLLVVCRNPSCLKEIDMSGNVIKTLDKNTNGDVLVTNPARIAMNNDQTLIYVTDCMANTVTTVTIDGKIKHVYKSDNSKYPVGVTVCRYDEVFVCSRDTHSIHQLSPTGQYTRVLLKKDQNLAKFPRAIEHSDDDNTLFISSIDSAPEHKNHIRVFQLDYSLSTINVLDHNQERSISTPDHYQACSLS